MLPEAPHDLPPAPSTNEGSAQAPLQTAAPEDEDGPCRDPIRLAESAPALSMCSIHNSSTETRDCLGGPTGQFGACGYARPALGAVPLNALRSPRWPPLTCLIYQACDEQAGAPKGKDSLKSPGAWGYSLAASIMLAQNRGCLCRGSSSGPLSL